jgi:hypothetical protein
MAKSNKTPKKKPSKKTPHRKITKPLLSGLLWSIADNLRYLSVPGHHMPSETREDGTLYEKVYVHASIQALHIETVLADIEKAEELVDGCGMVEMADAAALLRIARREMGNAAKVSDGIEMPFAISALGAVLVKNPNIKYKNFIELVQGKVSNATMVKGKLDKRHREKFDDAARCYLAYEAEWELLRPTLKILAGRFEAEFSRRKRQLGPEFVTINKAVKDVCKYVDGITEGAAKMRLTRAIEAGELITMGDKKSLRYERASLFQWIAFQSPGQEHESY